MKVLVVCSYGRNRSRYLAEYLTSKNIEATFAGAREEAKELQEKVNAADTIVTVHPEVLERLKEKCDVSAKRLIELNVDDRPEHVLPQGKKLDGDAWVKFQEEYVYPKLVKQVEEKMFNR